MPDYVGGAMFLSIPYVFSTGISYRFKFERNRFFLNLFVALTLGVLDSFVLDFCERNLFDSSPPSDYPYETIDQKFDLWAHQRNIAHKKSKKDVPFECFDEIKSISVCPCL